MPTIDGLFTSASILRRLAIAREFSAAAVIAGPGGVFGTVIENWQAMAVIGHIPDVIVTFSAAATIRSTADAGATERMFAAAAVIRRQALDPGSAVRLEKRVRLEVATRRSAFDTIFDRGRDKRSELWDHVPSVLSDPSRGGIPGGSDSAMPDLTEEEFDELLDEILDSQPEDFAACEDVVIPEGGTPGSYAPGTSIVAELAYHAGSGHWEPPTAAKYFSDVWINGTAGARGEHWEVVSGRVRLMAAIDHEGAEVTARYVQA